jgi:hypothetical protein
VTTEKEFDEEFDVDAIAQSIVDWHKKDLKSKYKTKRHNQ